MTDDARIDFDAFFAENYPSIVREAALVVGDAEVAREVAQDAFVQALVHWRRVSRYEFPTAWVRRVAFRRALRVSRDEAKHESAVERDAPIVDKEPPLDLRAAIAQLTAMQRAAVVLHYLDDLPVADVAKVIGCAESTAKVHLHRARQALGRMLQEEFDDTAR